MDLPTDSKLLKMAMRMVLPFLVAISTSAWAFNIDVNQSHDDYFVMAADELPANDGLDMEVLEQSQATSKMQKIPADNRIDAHQLSDIKNVSLNAISPRTLASFVELVNTIRTEYLQPVNDERLFMQAMEGMLKGLDPYSELLDRQKYDDLQAITQGGLGQVGIDLAFHDDLANWVVEAVEPDSSAAKQGIEVGDYVHAINEMKLTKLLNNKEVTAKLTGLLGSPVTLTVSAAGRQKRKVNLERSISTDASVSVIWQDGIAIVNIPVFQEVSRQQLMDELLDYPEAVRGVILDVRDNPGGVLESAVAIVSLFQKTQKPIAYVEDKQGIKEEFYPKGKAILAGLPVVVLQNRYSASASEVLASSLQNSPTAIVMGELSYGKGSVQSVFELDQDYAIKLTVAHYLNANRKDIDGTGVSPDVALLPLPAKATTKNKDKKFAPKPFQVNSDDLWLQQALLWIAGQPLNTDWIDTTGSSVIKPWQTDFPHGIRLSEQTSVAP